MFRKKEKDLRNDLERDGWKKVGEDSLFDIYSVTREVYDRAQHKYIDKVLTLYAVRDTLEYKQLDESIANYYI